MNGLTKGDAGYYLDRDKELIRHADELWICGPPSQSKGIQFEIQCAKEFDIPIRQDTEWMDPTYMPAS